VRIHTGHASHVLSVRFTHDDAFVLSIGADDSATMQWRVVQ
jgi:microtubule-associated protein-like 3